MAHEIEARRYGPDCTGAEQEALLSRVSLLAPGVVMLREIPVLSDFTVDLFMQRTQQLVQGKGAHTLLVDLTEAGRPDAYQRQIYREGLRGMEGLERLLVATGKNVVLNLALKFLLTGSFPFEVQIHESLEQLLESMDHAS